MGWKHWFEPVISFSFSRSFFIALADGVHVQILPSASFQIFVIAVAKEKELVFLERAAQGAP